MFKSIKLLKVNHLNWKYSFIKLNEKFHKTILAPDDKKYIVGKSFFCILNPSKKQKVNE